MFSFHLPSLRNSACAQWTSAMVPCTPETNLGLLIGKEISLDVPNAFSFLKDEVLAFVWDGDGVGELHSTGLVILLRAFLSNKNQRYNNASSNNKQTNEQANKQTRPEATNKQTNKQTTKQRHHFVASTLCAGW